MSSLGPRLQRAVDVVASVRDIVEERVEAPAPPAWCERRGWSRFLLGLDAETLGRAEAQGLATVLPRLASAPRDLRELARQVLEITSIPRVSGAAILAPESLRQVRKRKRAQLESLLDAVRGMAEAAERIVDVGAGSGHFTRLSADLFDIDVLGLERDSARVSAARQRSGKQRRAEFVQVDARQELPLSARDLAVGLHACGELGDRLSQAVATAGADLALVSCCLQKISSETRAPLSSLAAGLTLGRKHLGLANLTAQPQGVEVSIEATLSAREARYALSLLLRARGCELEPGAEMSGINRRRAGGGLAPLATRALAQRGLPAPSSAELSHFERRAAVEYAAIRRLSLPRALLSRALEVLVSLDRAVHLEAAGLSVMVATLFDQQISPRNIGIFASKERSRLPAAHAHAPC